MAKNKSFEWLIAHKKKRKKIVITMCINPQGTLSGKGLTALSDMAHRTTNDVQVQVFLWWPRSFNPMQSQAGSSSSSNTVTRPPRSRTRAR